MTEKYSNDFIVVRRAVYQNFVARDAPIKEEDLTPHDMYLIIYDVGKHFANRNIAGLTKVPQDDGEIE